MKEIDLLEKLKLFGDTMSVVDRLKISGDKDSAKHLHELWMLTRQLGNEVKQLRKDKT